MAVLSRSAPLLPEAYADPERCPAPEYPQA